MYTIYLTGETFNINIRGMTMGILDPVVEKLNSISDTITEMVPLVTAIATSQAATQLAVEAVNLKLDDVRALVAELKNSGVPAEEVNAILTKLTGMQASVSSAQQSLAEIKTASDALKTSTDAVKSEADSIE